MAEHVLEFVFEGLSILLGGEIAALLSPPPPCPGEPVEYLTGRALRAQRGLMVLIQKSPVRIVEGYSGLAKVLGDYDVGREV